MALKEVLNLKLRDFLVEYKFFLIEEKEHSVIYSNKECSLKFFREYADVYLCISDPTEVNAEFHIGILLRSLYNIKIAMFDEIYDPINRIDKQLANYIYYLTGKLEMVLRGDFSWSNKYYLFDQNN